MDAKRLLTGAVVGGVVMAGLGFLMFEVIFAGFFDGQMIVMPREAPIVWAIIVSSLTHGLLLTLAIGWADAGSVGGGGRIGALVGFLVWFGADTIIYGVFEYATLAAMLADSALSTLVYGVAGAAIGAVAGKGTRQAPVAAAAG
jgi:hypothetical protein